MTASSSDLTFRGYPRPDGRFGVRNHVAVLAVMDNVNPVVRRICAQLQGTVPICVAYGRGMIAEDREQHDRTLVHHGTHPNVAATLVVGLEPVTAERFATEIAKAGKPVEWIAVQPMGGTAKTVAHGMEIARRMVAEAARIDRVPAPLSALVIGLECGASDATSGLTANSVIGRVADFVVEAGGTAILSETDEIIGAEHLLAERAATPEVSRRLLDAVEQAEALARFQGVQLLPLGEDNKIGGLSTMEEKSMGAVRKGGTSPLMEVIGYGDIPSKRGLIFMDAPAPGVENIAAIAAGGAQVILFATGVGNPIGHPLVPTVKVTGNPNTAVTFADNIDVDLGGIITGSSDMDTATLTLTDALLMVANGAETKSEALGDTEISISRVDVAFLKARRRGEAALTALSRWSLGDLETFAGRILEQAGLSADDAGSVARVIVRTEARGVVTHGVSRLPSYVEKLQSGEYNPKARITHGVRAGALRLSGDGAMGQLAGLRAVELCCELAREQAVVMCLRAISVISAPSAFTP